MEPGRRIRRSSRSWPRAPARDRPGVCDNGTVSARDEWRAASESTPTRDADFTSLSGVEVDPVYGPDDGLFPGQYPYTRGPYASMYRSKLWTMRMFAGFGIAPDTNRRFLDLLASGSDGLSTA